MTRKHPARRPGPVHLNAVQRAIEAARKLPKEDAEGLKGIVNQAFLDFRQGISCDSRWRDMADALNIAEVLSELGICSDDASCVRIIAGQNVLRDVAERHGAGGSWTLKAFEIGALDDALWMHRIQLDHCSMGEYIRAREKVTERSRQALAGNVGPKTQMVAP